MTRTLSPMPDLFPYQIKGAEYLISNDRGLLFDDPGLGKTAQALCALPDNARAIVICPASVKSVWEREIKQWTGFYPVVLSGRNSFRYPDEGEVVILNPDILPDAPPLAKESYQIVVDEVHAFKSLTSMRSKKLQRLRKSVLAKGGSIWGLTGTPILSKPEDLWGILSALDLQKIAFGDFDYFARVFNGRCMHFPKYSKYVWGKPESEAATVLKKIALGRRRTEVLPELPTKTYETYEVAVPGYQGVFGGNEDYIHNAMQGFVPGALSSARAGIALSKAKAASAYLQVLSESEPLVIFTTHIESAEYLGKVFNVTPIIGSTSLPNRQALVDAFQSGTSSVIIGSIAAMGVGLTLTRANRVVFINRDWTPALNAQAEDRVCRIGQTKGVIVTDILCDDVTERLVYKILRRKQSLIDGSVEKAR